LVQPHPIDPASNRERWPANRQGAFGEPHLANAPFLIDERPTADAGDLRLRH
jgi:hypothetical protein